MARNPASKRPGPAAPLLRGPPALWAMTACTPVLAFCRGATGESCQVLSQSQWLPGGLDVDPDESKGPDGSVPMVSLSSTLVIWGIHCSSSLVSVLSRDAVGSGLLSLKAPTGAGKMPGTQDRATGHAGMKG